MDEHKLNNETTPENADAADVHAESKRERFSRTLKERASEITSVRNDVYTTQWWQLLLNFFLGGGALAFLLIAMIMKGTMSTVGAIVGVVLIVVLVVYNYTLRVATPTSFLQYTYLDKTTGKRYTYQVLSKTRSAFSDGENVIEVDRGEAVRREELSCARYKFDFFADMNVDVRIGLDDKEIYKGTIEHNGKTYKCKIAFRNSKPLYGSVGGGRIKYFDVNDTKEKFVVPSVLKRAVKACDIDFPKVQGLYVRDDVKDVTKQ